MSRSYKHNPRISRVLKTTDDLYLPEEGKVPDHELEKIKERRFRTLTKTDKRSSNSSDLRKFLKKKASKNRRQEKGIPTEKKTVDWEMY